MREVVVVRSLTAATGTPLLLLLVGMSGCGESDVMCTLLGCDSHFNIYIKNGSAFSVSLAIKYGPEDVDQRPAPIREKTWSMQCPVKFSDYVCGEDNVNTGNGYLILYCAYNVDCPGSYRIDEQLIPTKVTLSVESSDKKKSWSGSWVPEIVNRYPNGRRCDKWPCQTIEKEIQLR